MIKGIIYIILGIVVILLARIYKIKETKKAIALDEFRKNIKSSDVVYVYWKKKKIKVIVDVRIGDMLLVDSDLSSIPYNYRFHISEVYPNYE